MRRLLAPIVLLAFAVALPARAQDANPANQALAAEWQALALQNHQAEAAINRLIESYEARLDTALLWLRQARAEDEARLMTALDWLKAAQADDKR